MPATMLRWRSRNDLPLILNDLLLKDSGVMVEAPRDFVGHVKSHWLGQHLTVIDDTARNQRAAKLLVDGLRAAVGTCDVSIVDTDVGWELDYLLDFAWIGGSTEYADTWDAILKFYPLVRKGGIIAGANYVADGWHAPAGAPRAFASMMDPNLALPAQRFAVMAAVDNYFSDGEILVTDPSTDGGWQSWLAVKR